jgi:hypothetical protein
MKESHHYFRLWLNGTRGYGKSHLLAMLVCYFIANNARVIYIPDWRESLTNITAYVRDAMFLTWADDPDAQQEIMGLTTKEDVFSFLKHKGTDVILVVDQISGLQGDGEVNNDIGEAWGMINRLWYGRKAVLSASANYTTYLQGQQVETSNTTMRVNGGLTPVSCGKKIMIKKKKTLLTMIRQKWSSGGSGMTFI